MSRQSEERTVWKHTLTCDRCHTVKEFEDDEEYTRLPLDWAVVTIHDNQSDLCPACVEGVRSAITPLPLPEKPKGNFRQRRLDN